MDMAQQWSWQCQVLDSMILEICSNLQDSRITRISAPHQQSHLHFPSQTARGGPWLAVLVALWLVALWLVALLQAWEAAQGWDAHRAAPTLQQLMDPKPGEGPATHKYTTHTQSTHTTYKTFIQTSLPAQDAQQWFHPWHWRTQLPKPRSHPLASNGAQDTTGKATEARNPSSP